MIPSYLVISRYEEDYSWVNEYTNRCVIYNKGEPIYHKFGIYNIENIGGNQRDIFRFIVSYYNVLPDCIAFLQANPFDHCKKEVFDELIQHDYFTPLEYYGKYPANNYENRTPDGGFLEINNNWYIYAHNTAKNQTCRYSSFDQFMYLNFINYEHVDWIRFTPGSQYIVTKEQILRYPVQFWEKMMNELNSLSPTEGHIIERALYYIFEGKLEART